MPAWSMPAWWGEEREKVDLAPRLLTAMLTRFRDLTTCNSYAHGFSPSMPTWWGRRKREGNSYNSVDNEYTVSLSAFSRRCRRVTEISLFAGHDSMSVMTMDLHACLIHVCLKRRRKREENNYNSDNSRIS